MIHVVTLQDHSYTFRRMIRELGPGAKPLRMISYERLFHFKKAPLGHYIFTDFDRLTHFEREIVIKISDALRAADPALLILNDPRQVLERFALLRALYKLGWNRFDVTRLDDGSHPASYPVFVRCEDGHDGSDTELIHSEAELESALAELNRQGKVLKRRIAVEFCAQDHPDGLFRKYSALNINGAIIPMHIYASQHWHVKIGSNKPDPKVRAETLHFVEHNPYRERLEQIFRLAHIDVGRIDFTVVDGVVQTYEINTNPTFSPLILRPGGENAVRNKRRILLRQRLSDAIQALDSLPHAKGAVKFAIPAPPFHRMRKWQPISSGLVNYGVNFMKRHKSDKGFSLLIAQTKKFGKLLYR